MGQVPGISWGEFVEQILTHNPHLILDGNVFLADKAYVLPEVITEVDKEIAQLSLALDGLEQVIDRLEQRIAELERERNAGKR